MTQFVQEVDALDEVVARNGGKLNFVNTGIMETLCDPISLLLDNEDVSLDDVVTRNGGRLKPISVGFIAGEAVL